MLELKTILMIIFILSLFLILKDFDIKIIGAILVILYFLKEYSGNIKEKLDDIIEEKYDYVNYNSDIEEVLKKLKKYKKTDKVNYSESMYYWKLFMKQIKILEHKELEHYNQYFDKAEMYLKKTMNSFQSMIVSSKERTLEDGIKYGDHEYSKELSNLIKDLYKHGYLLLYNISLRLNEKWKENPNIYNKQIVMEFPFPNDNKDNSEYF